MERVESREMGSESPLAPCLNKKRAAGAVWHLLLGALRAVGAARPSDGAGRVWWPGSCGHVAAVCVLQQLPVVCGHCIPAAALSASGSMGIISASAHRLRHPEFHFVAAKVANLSEIAVRLVRFFPMRAKWRGQKDEIATSAAQGGHIGGGACVYPRLHGGWSRHRFCFLTVFKMCNFAPVFLLKFPLSEHKCKKYNNFWEMLWLYW